MRRECFQGNGGVPGIHNPRGRSAFWGLTDAFIFFLRKTFTEIRGRLVTHFRHLRHYLVEQGGGGRWGLINVYMDFVGVGS